MVCPLVAKHCNTVTWQIFFVWGLAEWQQMAKFISFFHTDSSMVVGIFLHLNLVDYSKYLGFLTGPEPPPLLLQLFYLFAADVGYVDVWNKLLHPWNICLGGGVWKHCILEWVYWKIHWSAIYMVQTKDIEKGLVFNSYFHAVSLNIYFSCYKDFPGWFGIHLVYSNCFADFFYSTKNPLWRPASQQQ